jgi:hypothetical protein
MVVHSFEGHNRRMTKRSRVLTFGGAGLLVVAGAVCAVLISGTLGQVLAFVLIALGLVAATALVFYEVGLSEDHERAREERARAAAGDARRTSPRRLRPIRPLDRMRGRPRRLR